MYNRRVPGANIRPIPIMTERRCIWCGDVQAREDMDLRTGDLGTYYFCPDCPSGEE